MARLRWLSSLTIACLLLAGCNKFQHKAPDPTKGVVTGVVLCSDTGKPARFATVTLTAAPKAGQKNDDADPLSAAEITITDLDGRFRIEAVRPGRYYAFATLEGYLDPALALDPDKLKSMSDDLERRRYSLAQWRDHLTEVIASRGRVSDISMQIERAAEISGTVTFDDGSPAIGMHFQLFRKTAKGNLTDVGLSLLDSWTLHAESNGHGRYNLTNLPAGEYAVCTLMPAESEDAAPRVCLGNTFRKRDAKSVKVEAGEAANGVDIEIPLSGLHSVAGMVSAQSDGHALARGNVRLLYADDRATARETSIQEDGTFAFEYVPQDKYILQVSGAGDAVQQVSESTPEGSNATAKAAPEVHYADKEIPLTVLDDISGVAIALSPVTPDKPAGP
ncbi:MAG: hypothetical protein ABSF28_09910 [Terracidiphilus sp.]